MEKGRDPFGNIQSIGGTSGRSTPTSSATNRLTGGTYDESGNLRTWNTASYGYDGFNQNTRMTSGAEDWIYIYTAGDERFWSFRVGGGGSLWALRDLDGKVLREYEAHVSWGTFRDYIYRGTQLLASSHTTEGVRHFHLDHLGTPRLITNSGGFQTAYQRTIGMSQTKTGKKSGKLTSKAEKSGQADPRTKTRADHPLIQDHPYSDLESSRVWPVISSALDDLIKNGDIQETTARVHIIGYLARRLVESGVTEKD